MTSHLSYTCKVGKEIGAECKGTVVLVRSMKVHWGVEVQRHSFLNTAVLVSELSASRPGHFAPTNEALLHIL